MRKEKRYVSILKESGAGVYVQVICLVMVMICAGCDGSSSGGGQSPLGEITGVYFDGGFVSGLDYETNTRSGVTDAEGIFFCRDGETITFSINGVVLGQAQAKNGVAVDYHATTIDVVTGAVDELNPTVTNICRLLQSLDLDGSVENGIIICDAVREEIAGRQIDFNQTIVDFENDPAVLNLFDALNAKGVFNPSPAQAIIRTLCSAIDAQLYMLQMLAAIEGNPSEFPQAIKPNRDTQIQRNCRPGQTIIDHDDYADDDESNEYGTISYIDVTKMSSTLLPTALGYALSATLYMQDVPTELEFNRIGVPEDYSEYSWQVCIDVDGNPQTGDQKNSGAEYEIEAVHFVFDPDSPVTLPFADGLQVSVGVYMPDGTYDLNTSADLDVDYEENTLKLTGFIPGISLNSRIWFKTSVYCPDKVPAIPVLTQESISGTQADFSWTATDKAQGYLLFYVTTDSVENTIGDFDAKGQTHAMLALESQRSYMVMVFAYNDWGASGFSNPVYFDVP